MAMMRFRVPNPSEFDPRFWQTAFVAGLDALPIASVNFLQDDELVLEISSRDSRLRKKGRRARKKIGVS